MKIRIGVLFALALLVPSIGSAQNQLPADFLGLPSLELGPETTAGTENDLITARIHRGHAADDIHRGLNSGAASVLAAPAGGIPSVTPQHVVPAGESVSGFAGLTHFDQRFAGTGIYVNTNFSL